METVEQTAFQSAKILSGYHQTDWKASVSLPQTSYGPEGRGFESLRAYQNHGNLLNFRGFAFDFCTFSSGLILQYRFDPSRDPYQSAERKSLESTGEEIPYRICRLLLHGGGHMGVSVKGESGAVVAQHGGEGFHVHSILQRQHGECVPLWHNKDKSENPCDARSWRFVLFLFPLKNGPEMGPARGGDNQGLHLKDKFF